MTKPLWTPSKEQINKANMTRFEAERAQLEARNLEAREEAGKVASKLDGQQFVVIRSASDTGSLYGSVSTRDVADAATEAGFSVERRQIVLERPIKELGIHPLHVVLHPEVTAGITVNVARSQEEADIQASGKTIAELRAEEEAEAEVDVAELFEDIGAAAAEDEVLAEQVEQPEGGSPESTDEPR